MLKLNKKLGVVVIGVSVLGVLCVFATEKVYKCGKVLDNMRTTYSYYSGKELKELGLNANILSSNKELWDYLNEEEKEYIKANYNAILDESKKVGEDYHFNKIMYSFKDDVYGTSKFLRDSFLMRDYIEGGLKAKLSIEEVLVDYYKVKYGIKVDSIEKVEENYDYYEEYLLTYGDIGFKVMIDYTDTDNIMYCKDTYGSKLTSKRVSELMSEDLKDVLPSGSVVDVWTSSALNINHKDYDKGILSKDLDSILKQSKLNYPINFVNLYIPVKSKPSVEDIKKYNEAVFKYSEKTDATRFNVIYVKEGVDIEGLVNDLYGDNRYEDATIEATNWVNNAIGERVLDGDIYYTISEDILKEKVYGYTRVIGIDNFNAKLKEGVLEDNSSEDWTKLSTEIGYYVKWYE